MDLKFKFTARRHFRVWIAALALAAGAIALAAQTGSREAAKERADVARFRARVAAILDQADASRLNWGIEVADRSTGETLYQLNADRFFAPASNAKIVTTSLALATLGRDFRFRTTLESNTPLDSEGRIGGDLVLVGRGDPDLSNRRFPFGEHAERAGPVEKVLAELVDGAVAKGLREVDGDIVADDSYDPYDPYPAGWSNGDLFFSFGAPVSALAFNDNSFSIEVSPASREGEAAALRVEPAAANGSFAYEVNTGPSNGKPDFSVVR